MLWLAVCRIYQKIFISSRFVYVLPVNSTENGIGFKFWLRQLVFPLHYCLKKKGMNSLIFFSHFIYTERKKKTKIKAVLIKGKKDFFFFCLYSITFRYLLIHKGCLFTCFFSPFFSFLPLSALWQNNPRDAERERSQFVVLHLPVVTHEETGLTTWRHCLK